MKTSIETASKKEGELIRKGLEDPTTRALVAVLGALAELPSDRARRRVLTHVADYFAELDGDKKSPE
jgi:hypothetical protein